MTNGESFANVKRWLQEIEHNCDVVNKVLGEFIFIFNNFFFQSCLLFFVERLLDIISD